MPSCRKIYHKCKSSFVRDKPSVTKYGKNRDNEDKASLGKWKLKYFGRKSRFINGLMQQFVFEEIAAISHINISAVRGDEHSPEAQSEVHCHTSTQRS